MKLNKEDEELLGYLYHNHKESVSEIARNTSLKRHQVEYRMKKYEDKGLIRKYFPVFNYSVFGYNEQVVFYLKFEKIDHIDIFLETLENHDNVINYGEIYNKYDIYLTGIFESSKDVHEFIDSLFKDGDCLVTDYDILQPIHSELYPLKFFNNSEKLSYILSEEKEQVEIDEKDRAILKQLGKDGRSKLKTLARAADISPENAHRRLKTLRKHVILGNRIQFDMTVLDFAFAQFFINFKLFDDDIRRKIKEYATREKLIQTLIINTGKPHCMIQYLYRDKKDLRKSIKRLRQHLSNVKIETDLILLDPSIDEIDPLPFL